jgi:subtilisin family serine protease
MRPTRRVLLVAAALVLAPGARVWTTPQAQAGAAVFRELSGKPSVRVVVSFREPDVPFERLAARMAAVADTRRAVLARLAPDEFRLTDSWDTASAFAGHVSAEGVRALLMDPEVRRVDVDVPMEKMTAESAGVIGANQAHDRGVNGAGIVVAVIDSGAQSDHPDIAPALAGEACFCTAAGGAGCCPGGGTTASGAGSANDDQGHGTNVSGIIVGRGAAAPRGIADGASLFSVKVLDRNGVVSSTAQVVSALDFIARNRPDVRVVNLSVGTAEVFGGGSCDGAAAFTQAFASVLNTLKARGTAVFASSGNSANTGGIAAPACISSVIAVGATYDGEFGSVSFGCVDPSTRADQVACFSNSSPAVDLLAPGGAITSSGMGGGASTFIGTSQASPHAAAVAALILQAKGPMSVDALLGVMQGTGQAITDPRNGIPMKRVDAGAATQ